MRKRLVIGAIAVVVIGIAVYVLLHPRRDSVEYHKKKYLGALGMGTVEEWIYLRGPRALHDHLFWRPREKRLDFHRKALLEAGYLVQREFVVSNRPARAITVDIYKVIPDVFTDTNDLAGMPFFYREATNRIRVLARSIDMAQWEKLIRKFDVPETK